MKDRSRSLPEWVALIDEWRQSGLKQPEFCRLKGIKPSTMQSRLYKTPFKQAIEAYRHQLTLAQGPELPSSQNSSLPQTAPSHHSSAPHSSSTTHFVPVRFNEPIALRNDPSLIEIILDSGRRIAVKPGFDQDTLRRVVVALES